MGNSYLKDLILNIILIYSPLVFYPYAYRYKNRPTLYRASMFVAFALALLAAMTFPVNVGGVVYDMRSIALALGAMYGGLWTNVSLYALAVGYRGWLDYPNNGLYLLSVVPSAVALHWLHRKFQTANVYRKVAIVMIGCTLIKIITFTIYYSFTDDLVLLYGKPMETAVTFLVQAVIAGTFVYFVEFLNNHYRMQDELINSEKATIVSNMAASVAHEIRNPLTSIRGFIQLMGSDALDPQKRSYYQRICLEELDRAQEIITDYLSLAKPEPEIVEHLDINEEIVYVSKILQSYANLNNTEIVCEVDGTVALHVVGDRHKFRQALINIGKNGIESMPGGGRIKLSSNKAVDGAIRICVTDTGAGMTTEQVRRLGTPYFSTKEKGTGLGTMVSFGIIRKMNGTIEVKSELGKGTEFCLTFPAA